MTYNVEKLKHRISEIEQSVNQESLWSENYRIFHDELSELRTRLKFKTKRIYVASSWRNPLQGAVVIMLRTAGFEVYDFKDEGGFRWSDIDSNWKQWTNDEYVKALDHSLALKGYKQDFDAMKWADTFVLVQPCGRSAHLELGWACGADKKTAILLGEEIEPELMAKLADFNTDNMHDLLGFLGVED